MFRCESCDGLESSAREDELEVVLRGASDPAVVYLIILLADSLHAGVWFISVWWKSPDEKQSRR